MSSLLDLGGLRVLNSRCLDECDGEFGDYVEFGADYYWLIEPTDTFDLHKASQPFVVAPCAATTLTALWSAACGLARPGEEAR